MVKKQLIGDVRVYSRHSKDCKHRADASYTKCVCRKWMQYQLDGKTVQVPANCRSFAGLKLAAEQKTAELRMNPEERRKQIEGKKEAALPISVGDAVAKWLKFRAANRLNQSKDEQAIRMCSLLVEWCKAQGIVFLQDITPAQIIEFRDSLPYKRGNSSSLSVHWTFISSLFRWATVLEVIPRNPVPDPRVHTNFRLHVDKPEVVIPTKEEMDRVIATIDKMGWSPAVRYRVRLFAMTQRYSGMAIRDCATLARKNEAKPRAGLAYLTDENYIVGNRHKTKERFRIQIPAWLAAELRGTICSDPTHFFWGMDERFVNSQEKVQPKTITRYHSDRLKAVCKAAKVSMTSHGFRHFRISELKAEGWSAEDIAAFVGTSADEIRKTYFHESEENENRIKEKQTEIYAKQGLDPRGNPIGADKPMV